MQLRGSVFHIARQVRSAWRGLPVVLGAVVVIAGCGGGSQRAATIAASSGQPKTTTSQTATQPQVAPRRTATRPWLGHRAADTQPAPVIAAGPLVRVFSGTRNKGIGSLSEKTPLVVGWTAAKPPIQIFTSQGNLLLSSDRRSGRIRLGSGVYPGLRVATNGHWTIQLRAVA
jgi:hypothetical protein